MTLLIQSFTFPSSLMTTTMTNEVLILMTRVLLFYFSENFGPTDTYANASTFFHISWALKIYVFNEWVD